jgi:hypothetical protein
MTIFFSKAFKALALSALFVAAGAQALPANAATLQPAITLPTLQGSWAATLIGETGCGWTTMYVTFTLDAAGHSLSTIHTHSGCGTSVSAPNLQFNIQSLNADGSGTASLYCSTNISQCGWNMIIQVSPDLQAFNMVDVSNPNNYVEGTAIRRL